MKLTTKLATVLLAVVGVAFSQPQQGQLNAQAANKKADYLKSAQLSHQQYAACMTNSSTSSAPPNCQSFLNGAAFYEAMAGAVTNSGDVPAATQTQLTLQRKAADTKFSYSRSAQLSRQQNAACMTNNSTSSAPPNCQSFLNGAVFYEAMAGAVTNSGDAPAATQKQLILQRKDADTKFSYLRSAQLARQQYAACLSNANAKPSTCQSYLNAAKEYDAKAAGYPQPLPK